MAELNEYLEFMGFDPDTSLDDFKQGINEQWGRRDALLKDKEFVQQVTGKALGSITTKIASMYKENGIELDKETIEKNPVEAVAKIGMAKLIANYDEKLEGIKADGSKNVDKRIAELKTQLDTTAREKTQIESMLNEQKEQFEQFRTQKETEVNGILTKHAYNREFGKFKFKPGVSDIERKGFEAEFKERFQTQYDPENDALIVTDHEGNKIPNPNKASTFKSFAEVLNDLGDEKNMRDANDGKREKTKFTPPGGQINTNVRETDGGDGKETTGDGRFRIRRRTAAQ